MIARLKGSLASARPDRALVDVGGVGYDVVIPLGTFAALPPVGESVTLLIHTHVREDALQLFGFASEPERRLFEKLISVSGIGPRVALTVLSGLPPAELARAIAAQDTRRLSMIPGIGKKLAERLGVELKDKMGDIGSSPPAADALPRTSATEDAVGALLNLGYKPSQAEAAVLAASKVVSPDDLNALIQAALRSLARP